MKLVSVLGSVCLMAPLLTACNNSSTTTAPPRAAAASADQAGALVGAWNCVSKGDGASPDVQDVQTFGADGLFSSSKYPEGKKYKYRLEDGKLVVSFATHEWTARITKLAGDALEYDGDATGQAKVGCRKAK